MTKQQYLQALQEALKGYSQDVQYEILSDFEEHFIEGETDGRSEDEICEELGPIEDVVQYLEQNYSQKKEETNSIFDKIISSVDVSFILQNTKESLFWHTAQTSPSLIIQTQKGTVHLKISKGESFRYAASSDKAMIDFTKDADTSTMLITGKIFSEVTVYIEVGEDVKDIQVYNRSGKVNIEDLRLNTLKATLNNGNCKIVNTIADVFDVTCKLGDIKLTSLIGEVIANTHTGDIVLREVQGDGTIETLAGDLRIKKCLGDTIVAKTKAGDIKGNGQYQNHTLSTLAGDIRWKCERNIESMSAESMAGDVKVNVNGDQKDVGCILKGVVGDVKNKSNITVRDDGKIVLSSKLGDVVLDVL